MAGFFENQGLRLLIFGGKGGCGKTTSAAAAALRLAQARPDAKVLLVSTDPAHSLSDALEHPLGAEETAVPRVGAAVPGMENLWAVEIDAQALDEDFRGRHGGILKEIAEQGTLFDREDVERLFAMPMPGLDEAMAILYLAEALRLGRYDVVILDTAPTGHTLRMLAMPEHMRQWNRILGLMQARRRRVALAMAGGFRRSPADRFLETTGRDLEGIAELLKNARSTEFVPVTVPEPMAVLETERLVNHLRECGISVRSIVLNRMEQGRPECGLCLSRSAAQRKTLAFVRERFASCDLIPVPLFPDEVRGKKALNRYAEFLARPTERYREAALPTDSGSGIPSPMARSEAPSPKVVGAPPGTSRDILRDAGEAGDDASEFRHAASGDSTPGSLRRLEDNAGLKFLLFGGKGGVGKTSLATATALRLAERFPARKVLLFSTDPAHSLSDCLDAQVGDRLTSIPRRPNLQVLEINAPLRYEDFKRRCRTHLAGIFDSRQPGSGVDIPLDQDLAQEMVGLFPAGLDEIMAVSAIMDFVNQGAYDLYVLDTAPTGHLLRFLELPGLIRECLSMFMRLILKYRAAGRLDKFAQEMLDLSAKVRALQGFFADASQSEFVAVTIPEAMAVLETKRLLSELDRLKFACRHVIVNMVVPPAACAFCRAKRSSQKAHLRELESWDCPERSVSTLCLRPRPVQGMQMTYELSRSLFG